MKSEEKLLFNCTLTETRIAWVKNNSLEEIWIERSNKKGLVGNIYYGKVERVLPSMQAAFVNIGLEKTAFLHVSDICNQSSNKENSDSDDISKLLRPGQEILVQVLKEQISSKGARLTMMITIASNLVVFLPTEKMIGVSKKVKKLDERNRLKSLVKKLVKEEGIDKGFIVRTTAQGAGMEELRAEILYLEKLWGEIQDATKNISPSRLVYDGLPLFLQILRDLPVNSKSELLVDSKETFKKMYSFSMQYRQDMLDKLIHYTAENPIFDLYNVENEIQHALERKVDLKSGGYLIFDQTEAMTAIDVNTGSFVGTKDLEKTIYKTNLEATKEVARQLRLRNLGGIIILDLINMEEEKHKESICFSLKKALAKDSVHSTMSGISDLGLIEMTRQRTRESLERVLCEPCHVCHSRGTIKTAETVSFEIFREITRMSKQFTTKKYRVIAADVVVEYIQNELSTQSQDLEDFLGKRVSFQVEKTYISEQFDVVIS